MGFRLIFTDNNVAEEGHHIYRSSTSMAGLTLAEMPAPIATLAPDETVWDDGTVTPGDTYYYRVGAFTAGGSVELLGEEFEAEAVELDIRARESVTITLVVNDMSHGSTGNVLQALLDAGFLDENITVELDGQVPTPGDVIVVNRAIDSSAKWTYVDDAWAAGTPVLLGSVNNATSGIGKEMPGTFARLTGTYRVVSSGNANDEEYLEEASSYITGIFMKPGSLHVYTSGTWYYSLTAGQPYVGQLLATGDLDTPAQGEPTLIAVPAGTPDLDGNPTPTRSVVWANQYGLEPYTADGAELIGRIIDWCLSSVE